MSDYRPPGIILPLLLALCPLFYGPPVGAEIYKWTDEDGNVVYGDRPAAKQEAGRIKLPGAPKARDGNRQRLQKQQKLLEVMQAERAEKAARRQKAKADLAERQRQCAALKKELNQLENARFLYEKSADPYNPAIISEQERAEIKQRYADYLKDNC